MAFDWTDLIDPALGTAGNIASSVITNKLGGNTAQNSVNEQARQFDITQQNRNQMLERQDQFRRMAMPGLLTNLGKLPSQSRAITDAYRTPGLGSLPGGAGGSGGSGIGSKLAMLGAGAAGGYAANELMNRDSGGGINPEVKRILDMGTKMGLPALGGTLGLGGATAGAGAGTTAAAAGGTAAGGGGVMGTLGALATNPITLIGAGALGAGLLAKKLVGRGRKSANKLTGEGGIQRAFDETMGDIDQMANLTPTQKQTMKQQEYNTLVRMGLDRANSGSRHDRLTTWQMFNTISPLFGRPNPMGPNRPS